MGYTYDRAPLEVIDGAISHGEVQLREAREYLAESEKQVEAAKIIVRSHVERLAKWQAVRDLIVGQGHPVGDPFPESYVDPEPQCVYGCGRKVFAEGNWCCTSQCLDAHTEFSGGDVDGR